MKNIMSVRQLRMLDMSTARDALGLTEEAWRAYMQRWERTCVAASIVGDLDLGDVKYHEMIRDTFTMLLIQIQVGKSPDQASDAIMQNLFEAIVAYTHRLAIYMRDNAQGEPLNVQSPDKLPFLHAKGLMTLQLLFAPQWVKLSTVEQNEIANKEMTP